MDGASARTGTVDDEDDGDLMVQRSWKWDWEGGTWNSKQWGYEDLPMKKKRQPAT